jgi:hypothetical protein
MRLLAFNWAKLAKFKWGGSQNILAAISPKIEELNRFIVNTANQTKCEEFVSVKLALGILRDKAKPGKSGYSKTLAQIFRIFLPFLITFSYL